LRELTIDGVRISDENPAYLIAEIGHNHGGELGKAVQMVDDAIDAGADAVKFQTRTPSEVYAPGAAPGAYNFQSDNPQWLDSTYGVHREKLEFSPEEWAELFETCRARGITAFSTPFDRRSADMLAGLDVPAFKIASGDATNTPLIKHVASFGKPMILSTGGCSIEDVDRITETLGGTSTPYALLQCSCIYPAPNDVLNLRVIPAYRERYRDIVVGLSTHASSWYPTLAAFALGGRIFEHHFTHDREWQGTDNHFSLEPSGFRQLREACDSVLDALGSSEKRRDQREESYTLERQKALYWKRDLFAGHVITEDDIIAMCPNPGPHAAQPYEIDQLLGRPLAIDVKRGEVLVAE
jgi:sialic acid synthase